MRTGSVMSVCVPLTDTVVRVSGRYRGAITDLWLNDTLILSFSKQTVCQCLELKASQRESHC